MTEIYKQFGEIDIYLFDQILRGRILPGMKILDVGCGYGRNLVYFLQNDYQVFGVDQDPVAINDLRRINPNHFRVEQIESMSFPDHFADVVISNAVLHFAESDSQFDQMLKSTWRTLKPNGLFFCRLASSIGIEHQIQQLNGNRYLLPDGSERYLVNESILAHYSSTLRATPIDPLKTTVVQNERSMTTWVLRKDANSKFL